MSDLFQRFLGPKSFSANEIELWHQLKSRKNMPSVCYEFDHISPAKKKRSRLRRSSFVPSKRRKAEDEKIVVCGASVCILQQGKL